MNERYILYLLIFIISLYIITIIYNDFLGKHVLEGIIPPRQSVEESFSVSENSPFKVSTRSCKINYINPDKGCNSKFMNMGKLQLFHQLQLSKATNAPKETIEDILFAIKHKEEFGYNVGCSVVFKDWIEPNQDIQTKTLYSEKNATDPNLIKNHGALGDWASCYIDMGVYENTKLFESIQSSELPISSFSIIDNMNDKSYGEIKFNNLDFKQIQQQVCSTPGLKQMIVGGGGAGGDSSVSESAKFYRIGAKPVSLKDLDSGNKLKLFLSSIDVVRYNSETRRMEPIDDDVNVDISKLFGITYDRETVYCVPRKRKLTFKVFRTDLCNDLGISNNIDDTYHDVPFSLYDFGVREIKIIGISSYQFNNQVPKFEVVISLENELTSSNGKLYTYLDIMKENIRKINSEKIANLRNEMNAIEKKIFYLKSSDPDIGAFSILDFYQKPYREFENVKASKDLILDIKKLAETYYKTKKTRQYYIDNIDYIDELSEINKIKRIKSKIQEALLNISVSKYSDHNILIPDTFYKYISQDNYIYISVPEE
jgi:hypothetical protein